MMQRNRIINDENESAVVTAINGLGERFTADIERLSADLKESINQSQDDRIKNAESIAGLQSKVAGLHRIVWWGLGIVGSAEVAFFAWGLTRITNGG